MKNIDYSCCKKPCIETQCRESSGSYTGNSIDIKLNKCEKVDEINADIKLNTNMNNNCNVVRLWGQVKDCNGCPIPNALLKLIKVEEYCGKCQYKGVAHTVSDCEGFYQFDLCYCDGNECYKILVSRTNSGGEELVLITGDGNCNVCNPNNPNLYHPCEPTNQRYKKMTSCNCNCYTQPQTPPYNCCNEQQNNYCENTSQCKSNAYYKTTKGINF